MKRIFCKKNFYIFCSIFVLALFAYITYKTPLSGDDWGYYINGSLGTPIKTALEYYLSWSGRFFSELWGMIVPSHKWIWNIVNPLLFFSMFICIYKLAYVKDKYVLACLLILSMMLSVDDNLRMETYSFIMGTTYIIPLFLSLLYFVLIDKMMKLNLYDKKLKICCYLINVPLFIIGLMMENIAATMIVGELVLIIYAYFNSKQAIKYLIINLIVSVVSFTIMRMSPGSATRLLNEHPDWCQMSLFEKIVNSYPNFLNITFIKNNYAITLFSICMILLILFSHKKVKLFIKIINIIVLLLGIVNVFSFVFNDTFLNDYNSLYSFIFWPIYTINAFTILFIYVEDEYKKIKSIFLLMIAGCSALVMLYSPIYGSRCAVYTIYYLIVVSVMILDYTRINKRVVIMCLFIIFMFIVFDRSKEYIYKYHLVGVRQEERLKRIQYYKDHPEIEEVWIRRFPIYTIHGADDGDAYRYETFKVYYGLPQSAENIHFY